MRNKTVLGFDKPPSLDDIRKDYARVNVYDARNEIDYRAKRTGLSMVVRKLASLTGQLIENSADMVSGLITDTVGAVFESILGPEIARNLGLFAGAVGSNIAGIASVSLAASVSAAFAEMDYFHQKRNLRDLYAEELGAKLGKPAASVSVSDMEALAERNPVLDEELKRMRKQRNFAIPLAVVATLASFSMVMCALPAMLTAMSLPALSGVGGFLIKGAVSMATYMAVKMPLQKLGNKLFDLNKDTVNDRIVEIRHAHACGVAVTPEDLARVMKANPGREALENLARDINNGSVNATELLFASIGEQLGVPRKAYTDKPVTEHPALPSQEAIPFQDRFARHDWAASFAERIAQPVSVETALIPG